MAALLIGESWLLADEGVDGADRADDLLDARINVFAALIVIAVVSTALAIPLARFMLAQTGCEIRNRFGPRSLARYRSSFRLLDA